MVYTYSEILSSLKKEGNSDTCYHIDDRHYKDIMLCEIMCARSHFRASLIAQSVKNLPAVQETQVRSLGWENPLEKEMATHSGILAWRIPWTEEPGGLQSTGLQRVGHD